MPWTRSSRVSRFLSWARHWLPATLAAAGVGLSVMSGLAPGGLEVEAEGSGALASTPIRFPVGGLAVSGQRLILAFTAGDRNSELEFAYSPKWGNWAGEYPPLRWWALPKAKALLEGQPDVPGAPMQYEGAAGGVAFYVADARGWMNGSVLVSGALPLWVFAVPLAVRLFRRWRRRAGSCRVCGYDLRASPERCPECGTVVSA